MAAQRERSTRSKNGIENARDMNSSLSAGKKPAKSTAIHGNAVFHMSSYGTSAGAHAPCAAESFTYLAGKKFFDNSICHRMVTSGIYVLQCGDPSATGTGGPDYRYNEENLPTNKRPAYPEGVVAIANGENPRIIEFRLRGYIAMHE